jgi:hypothetical protein
MSKSNEPAGPRTHSAAGPAGIRYGEGVDVVSEPFPKTGVVGLGQEVTHRRLATRRLGQDEERRHRRAVRQETKKK